MCGRYNVLTSAQGFLDLLHILIRMDVSLENIPRFNISPTQRVLAVYRPYPNSEAHMAELRWGLIPHWAKEMSIGNRLINARSETAANKPAFRFAYRSKRCLIAADGWYEWKKLNGHKQPYNIRRQDRLPFYFAGLWDSWKGMRDGVMVHLHSCTILTADASDSLKTLHPRMPVALAPGDYERWLDSELSDTHSIQAMIQSRPMNVFEAYPVSNYVNKPSNDQPQCIQPISA